MFIFIIAYIPIIVNIIFINVEKAKIELIVIYDVPSLLFYSMSTLKLNLYL